MKDELQEVEVKLHSPDLEAVKESLAAAKAIPLTLRVFEKNTRYDNADGALTAAGIVLRLRQDEAVRLTYKADATVERGIVSRFEAEVELWDFETMDLILKRLGYEVALVYEKYRSTYTLADTVIVLDELPFGNFTEIEGDAAAIERVVEDLGLGGCTRLTESYVDIFWAVKARLGLVSRDCSFEAFAGVDVDLGDLV